MNELHKTLPDKPSELIALALHDLRRIEATRQYVVDMGEWHSANHEGNKCAVCFAGSVMAQSLGMDPSESVYPESAGSKVWPDDPDNAHRLERQLDALDDFREGEVEIGLRKCGVEAGRAFDVGCEIEFVPEPYDPDDPEPFKADMEKLAARLAMRGL